MSQSGSLKNKLLRFFCRAYPFRKGRYRLLKFCEGLLEPRREVVSGFHGCLQLSLNLAEKGLQSSFYYFLPEDYEAGTQRYVLESVREGMVALDVGAHIGLFSLLMAHRTGPNGKVYSFEPELKNFISLKSNADLNHFTWIYPFQTAVSNKTGEDMLAVNLSDSNHALGCALGAHLRSSDVSTQTVQTITLDDFVEREGIGRIDLIKIDAEESEHLVLEGARRSFERGLIEEVICEIHSSEDRRTVGRDSIRKALYAYGYKSYVLNPVLSRKRFLAELYPNESVHGLQNLLFKK